MAVQPPPKRRESVETDVVKSLREYVQAGGPHEVVRVQRKCMGGCGRATAAAVIVRWHGETRVLQLCVRCLEGARVVLT